MTKADYKLEQLDTPGDDQGRLEDIEAMPDEKVALLYRCAEVRKVICDNCGEQTWLIGASGWNSNDTCHHCGEEYYVVG